MDKSTSILQVFLSRPQPIAARFENGLGLLLIQPAQKLLKAFVGANLFDAVEYIAQFVMRPGFVDKILATVAGGYDLPAAFASRHNVMASRGHGTKTESANISHIQNYDLMVSIPVR